MAAAPGNQYAAKERVWAAAINKALEKRSKVDRMTALTELAEKLLAQCDEGNLIALKELGDRLDGKPHQTQDTNHSGAVEVVELVRYANQASE